MSENRKEKELLYKATTILLCPQCEGKSVHDLMLEHIFDFPFLVRTKCDKCNYTGMLAEVKLNPMKNLKMDVKA